MAGKNGAMYDPVPCESGDGRGAARCLQGTHGKRSHFGFFSLTNLSDLAALVPLHPFNPSSALVTLLRFPPVPYVVGYPHGGRRKEELGREGHTQEVKRREERESTSLCLI